MKKKYDNINFDKHFFLVSIFFLHNGHWSNWFAHCWQHTIWPIMAGMETTSHSFEYIIIQLAKQITLQKQIFMN